jgi:hypothetical protein
LEERKKKIRYPKRTEKKNETVIKRIMKEISKEYTFQEREKMKKRKGKR